MITVAETAEYFHRACKLMSEEECAGLIAYLAAHPMAGDLIEGTGGIRKLRWGRDGRGKRWC